MKEDYLWDRGGVPDIETARLEKLLGELRYRGGAKRQPWRRRTMWMLAAAAVALIGLAALPLLLRQGPLTPWQLANGRRVRAGQTIETGALQGAKIVSNQTGEVTIDPGSRFRLVAVNNREERFDLVRGAIHAFIWAPPGKFVVDTPSSKTIDLGCRYTLQVSENGQGLLNVEFGWVAFERNGVESFIPAGAACVTRPKRGPGTPYFTDAPPGLAAALARFDEGDLSALPIAIGEARPRDALSLWHLLLRTNGAQRGEVFDRLSHLIQLPPRASREAVLAGNHAAIDAAWSALGLGGADWWRNWKQTW